MVGHDRERASLADLALEALTEPVVVCDADGTLVYVNAAAARLLGEPASALVGRLAETLLAPRSRMVDGQPFFRWLSGYPWQRGEGVRATLRRPDGVEIEQSFRVSTARRATGQPLTVVVLRRAGGGSADPLQQASEAPLPESTYRAVFDAVPVGVLHFDARARITACNDLFVQQMGSARHVLIGLDMLTLPNEEVRRAVREALAGRDGHFEGEYVSATGGARRLMRALFSPIMRDGRVAGGVGIVEDISERTEIEARLAQGERMASLGRLAAGVAHEINNPLAYVRTSLDIARREIERFRSDGDASRLERVLELIAHADDGVERVRVIANDLKTFSRGDEASWTAVDFGRVVETAINLAWNEIRHRAELVRRIDRVPPVMGSESRYVQVVVNLLVNAAQAIPEGHAHENRITVRVGRVDDSRVFLEVEDTGSGIDADRVKHVFEPFWTSKPKGVGTGLGLSICHGIVTAAGGEIRVARSQPGVGTTFRIELPAAPELDGEATAEMDAWVLEPPREERRARILVVDDEPKLGTTLRLALGDRYQVDVVDNGRDAQRILEEDGEFDLVLCDLMMPDVSGMDLYERVAAHRPDLAARFAFMTGGAFTERGRAFLRDHRVPRLEKPFSLDRVEELLRERMEQAPRS